MSTVPSALTPDEESAVLRALSQYGADAVLITDFDSACVVDANQAALRLFRCDREDLIGRTGRSLSDPEDAALIDKFSAKLVSQGEAWHPAYPFRNFVGRRLYADTRVRVVELPARRILLTVIRDVTEQLDLSRRVARVERYASLGRLAGSIAHEINNPATVVTNNTELIRRELEALSPEARTVLGDLNRETATAIDRIVELVRDLSSHASVDDRVELVSMDDIARSAARIGGASLRATAALELNLRAPRPVHGRRRELVQAVVNIIRNASEAIGEGSPSENEVRIETGQDAAGARLTVTDTGPGVPDEIAQRLFEAFVSTRPPGGGIGLGLAIASSVASEHGGSLSLDATGPSGSRFTLRIPFATGLELTPIPTIRDRQVRRDARLLIADDEPNVGKGLARLLAGRFDVVVVAGGRAALEMLERQEPFDYLLFDVVMPDLDGPALFEAIRDRRPDLLDRLVWMTAGTLTPRLDAFVLRHQDRLLGKPFQIEELDELIARIG